MPKIIEVPESQIRAMEPYTFVERDAESGSLRWGIDTRYGFGVYDSDDVLRKSGRDYYIALTVDEMESLLPLIMNEGLIDKRRRLLVPLTVLSQYVDADPREWGLWPVDFERYGLEIVNGKLVKKRRGQVS